MLLSDPSLRSSRLSRSFVCMCSKVAIQKGEELTYLRLPESKGLDSNRPRQRGPNGYSHTAWVGTPSEPMNTILGLLCGAAGQKPPPQIHHQPRPGRACRGG
ncbi:hypothetical protein BDM02DRAFT_472770 [Thelephora ganbajun]|uniref:Uncharacterized protein n=1 Tax=Thelephora ganbajun TaxID=370292 RepID=A0ACB6Z7J7_THEGA|nr:hypothetical protein BDM02DRAFT_472770 [Thelephora ganbajun]